MVIYLCDRTRLLALHLQLSSRRLQFLPAATKLGQGNIFTGVCLSTAGEGCLPQCMLGYTPPEQTPPQPDTHTPRPDTPPDQTPPSRPETSHPPRADPPGSRPPRPDTPSPRTRDPPQSRHPPGAGPPQSRHPLPQTRHTPGPETPREQTPPPRSIPPWTRHPPRSRPPQTRPPWSRHPSPGKQTSAYGQRAAGTHPTGMHSCWNMNRTRCCVNTFA